MQRRRFVVVLSGSVAGIAGCSDTEFRQPGSSRRGEPSEEEATPSPSPEETPPEGEPSPTATPDETVYVDMYDTYAQALYYDGTYGPLTGIVEAEYILVGEPVTLPFWHGHGGVQHTFTLTPAHYAQLKAGTRITIETSVVQSHTHTLFVDPLDPNYRVPGAEPVPCPV